MALFVVFFSVYLSYQDAPRVAAKAIRAAITTGSVIECLQHCIISNEFRFRHRAVKEAGAAPFSIFYEVIQRMSRRDWEVAGAGAPFFPGRNGDPGVHDVGTFKENTPCNRDGEDSRTVFSRTE